MAASFGAVAVPWAVPACEPVPVCGRVAVWGAVRWPLLWIEGEPVGAVCAVWAKTGSIGGFAASVGGASVGAFAASVGALVASVGVFAASVGALLGSVGALGVGSGMCGDLGILSVGSRSSRRKSSS